jgi:hypothetical protein
MPPFPRLAQHDLARLTKGKQPEIGRMVLADLRNKAGGGKSPGPGSPLAYSPQQQAAKTAAFGWKGGEASSPLSFRLGAIGDSRRGGGGYGSPPSAVGSALTFNLNPHSPLAAGSLAFNPNRNSPPAEGGAVAFDRPGDVWKKDQAPALARMPGQSSNLIHLHAMHEAVMENGKHSLRPDHTWQASTHASSIHHRFFLLMALPVMLAHSSRPCLLNPSCSSPSGKPRWVSSGHRCR